MSALGVAVVGFGSWGRNLARNFRSSSESELRWVCDLDGERSASARRLCTVGSTRDLDEALDDRRVSAVVVATSPQSHFELASRCLDAGRHVLVEKPMACSVPEGEQLTRKAEELDLVLMCDHTYCYSPIASTIRELVLTGSLGTVSHIESTRLSQGKVQSEVDVFWDLAAHDFAILDYILPDGCRISQVAARGADLIGGGQACSGQLDAQLSDGATACVRVSWLSEAKVRRFTVMGTRRVAVWDDLSRVDRLTVHDLGASIDDPGQTMRVLEFGAVAEEAPGRSGHKSREEPLEAVVRELVAAISERREPRTGGRSALRVLHGLTAVSRSLASSGAAVVVGSDESQRSTSK